MRNLFRERLEPRRRINTVHPQKNNDEYPIFSNQNNEYFVLDGDEYLPVTLDRNNKVVINPETGQPALRLTEDEKWQKKLFYAKRELQIVLQGYFGKECFEWLLQTENVSQHYRYSDENSENVSLTRLHLLATTMPELSKYFFEKEFYHKNYQNIIDLKKKLEQAFTNEFATTIRRNSDTWPKVYAAYKKYNDLLEKSPVSQNDVDGLRLAARDTDYPYEKPVHSSHYLLQNQSYLSDYYDHFTNLKILPDFNISKLVTLCQRCQNNQPPPGIVKSLLNRLQRIKPKKIEPENYGIYTSAASDQFTYKVRKWKTIPISEHFEAQSLDHYYTHAEIIGRRNQNRYTSSEMILQSNSNAICLAYPVEKPMSFLLGLIAAQDKNIPLLVYDYKNQTFVPEAAKDFSKEDSVKKLLEEFPEILLYTEISTVSRLKDKLEENIIEQNRFKVLFEKVKSDINKENTVTANEDTISI